MEEVLTKAEQKSKLSEIPNLLTDIVYSSDSDCEYRVIRTIVRLKRDNSNSTCTCNFCPQRFRRRENLQTHTQRYHPDQFTQQITIVPDIVSVIDNKDNITLLSQDINDEKFNNLYESCKLCNESYISIDIANHAKICSVLNNPSTSENALKSNELTCLEEEAVKSEINQDEDSFDEDEMEVETLELDDEELLNEETGLKEECSKCGEMYIAEDVANHAKVCPAFNNTVDEADIRIGLDPTMGRCHKCNEIYILAEIEQHIKVCKEVQNVTFDTESLCPICGKIFQTHKLKGHMKVHGEKTFLCTICGKGCVSSTALKVHFQSHTKEYRHECHLCKKKFSTRHTLKEHLRIHSGKKEFACELCPKSFTQQNGLKQHMVHCHIGIKKLACDYCDKRFHKNSDLKEHLKVHTKERSYACDVCGSQFIHSGSLRKHKRKFHSTD